MDQRREVLVVGYPDFLPRRLAEKILAEEPLSQVLLIVTEARMPEAQRHLSALDPSARGRVTLYQGDLTALDMGMPGEQYLELLNRATHVYHSGMSFILRHPDKYLYDRNVLGTRNLLDFCKEAPRLQRLYFYGSVHASGSRTGLIREAEFAKGQKFKSHIEYTWYTAEKLVRHVRNRVGITVFRLGNVIGDSKTGEIDGFEGPYLLIAILLMHWKNRPLILPGRCEAYSHLVPVDYVVNSTYHISMRADSNGETYHIVDPRSLRIHRVLRMVTSYLGTKPPIFGVPAPLLRLAYTVPGLKKKVGIPFDVFRYFNHDVKYSTTTAQDALQGAEIACPDFESYFPITIEYAERRLKEERERAEERESIDALEPQAWES